MNTNPRKTDRRKSDRNNGGPMGEARFAVPPAGKAAWLLLIALTLVVPLTGIGLALWLDPPAAASAAARVLVGTAVFRVVLAVVLSLLLLRRTVRLRGGELVVGAAMYTRRVPVARLDLDAARIVDLRERTELRPLLKTNGYSLPGFHAGRYRLRDRSSAFALVTDPARVLVLPVPGEPLLLLSLERPKALLDALHEAAGRPA